MATANFFKKAFLLSYLLFVSFSIITVNAQSVRGLYVNDFKNIIGDTNKENTLLQFAQKHNFNYLLLYNLYSINRDLFDLTNSESAQPLSDFIHKAKTEYGIKEVGAVGEKTKSFATISAFNQLHAQDMTRRFDVYNLEFEFWHEKLVEDYYCTTYLQESGYECSIEGAFEFYHQQLLKLKQLASANHVRTETYIGLTTSVQAKKIGSISDRVLVHYYRQSDVYKNGNSIYTYYDKRLKDLSPSRGSVDIVPIFSARSYHMGPWLLDHSKEQAYTTFMYGQRGFDETNGKWKNHVKIAGYQWYRYTDLSKYVSGHAAARFVSNVPPVPDEIYKISHLTEHISEYKTESDSKHKQYLNSNSIKLFPNPSSQQLFLSLDQHSNADIKVTNIYGEVVLSKTLKDQTEDQLNIVLLENGIYFLVVTEGKEEFVKKFVVEN